MSMTPGSLGVVLAATVPPLWYPWAGITAATVLSTVTLFLTVRHDPAKQTRWLPALLHLAWCVAYWLPSTMRLTGIIAPDSYQTWAAWMAGPLFLVGPWGMWPVFLLIGLAGRREALRRLVGETGQAKP